jgi:hypothetical protein
LRCFNVGAVCAASVCRRYGLPANGGCAAVNAGADRSGDGAQPRSARSALSGHSIPAFDGSNSSRGS